MKTRKVPQADRTWLWQISKQNRLKILGLLLIQVLQSIGGVSLAWVLRGTVNHAIAGERHGFFSYAATFVGISLVLLVLSSISRFLEESTRSSVENAIKSRLFDALLTKDFASVTAVHSGEWMSRLTSDSVVVADGLTLILPNVAGMTVKILGALVLLAILVPQLTCILIPGGILLTALTYVFRRGIKRLHLRVQESNDRVYVFLQERLGNLLIVRSFAREAQTLSEAEAHMTSHRRARMQKNRISNLCNLGFGLAMRGAYVLGAVFCGLGILNGTMSYGTFTAVLQLVSQAQAPLAGITGYLPKYYAMLSSAERLRFAESFPDACDEPTKTTEQIRDFYANELTGLQLEHAFFAYPAKAADSQQEAVLRDITLTVTKGEYVALTGLSGCGKSTLLKLMMCFYPLDRGTRFLKTRSGDVPLLSSYRQLFAYVPQSNQLLCGTIREIVTFSGMNTPEQDDAVWHALTIACANEYVAALPQGLDTMLGERGAGLSEGQMQRIAIARAIFSGNPILMLDESTSALDEATERRLLNNLRRMTDRTVLIVTHRPAALAICDKQIEVAKGSIVVHETPNSTS